MNWLVNSAFGIGLLCAGVLCGAILAGLLIVFALRRKRMLLSRRWSDWAVRSLAGLLILLPAGRQVNAGLPDAPPDPRSPDDPELQRADRSAQQHSSEERDESEQAITKDSIARWRHWSSAPESRNTFDLSRQSLLDPFSVIAATDDEFAAMLENAPGSDWEFGKLVRADLTAIRNGAPAPAPNAQELLQALGEFKSTGLYDQWWNAYFWRKTKTIDANEQAETLRALFARMERHARIADALVKASFEVKPNRMNPRAWMSKAGPTREMRVAEEANVAALLAAAQRAYADGAPTTWRRDAVVRLKLSEHSSPAVLWREGVEIALQPGETFSFGRLDLLHAMDAGEVLIEDVKFGALQLEASATATVWTLPSLISAAGQESLQKLVTAALNDNDENAARQLEIALPLSHAAIREELAQSPDAPGAPRLRLILSLFDDRTSALDEPASQELRVPPKENPQRREGPGAGMFMKQVSER